MRMHFSNNSHMWVAADIATICNGGVSVPIYPTSSQSDIEFIIDNSQSKIIFVQNDNLLKKILNRAKLPHLEKIILLNAPSGGKSLAELAQSLGLANNQTLVIGVEELLTLGRGLKTQEPDLIDIRITQTELSDLATIIYTSGTTGTPKGAALSHANISAIVDDMKKTLPIDERDVYLSYLPLSHVFERICGEFYWMHSGGEYAFAESIETMAKNLSEVHPTMLLVVPRVLDRIYAKVKSGMDGAAGSRRLLISWALSIGIDAVQISANGQKLSPLMKLKHLIAERLVFKKLREKIAPRLRLVVSGGAPATAQTIEFFNAIGITTLEGYGLTETSAPATVNRLDRVKIGTVGLAMPSVEIKIAEDGEILLRGPSIFKGYYRADQATAEAFADGWFHTGDIGIVDGTGYLKITDRKKDLIVNSAGKNIAPQRVESILKTVPHVSQAVVFGDKQKSLVALIVLDEAGAADFGRENSWEFDSFADLIKLPALNQYIRKEIQSRSGSLADYEIVKRFAILPEDLSVDAGELTATLKIKRSVVAKKYKPVIEALYRDETVDAAALVSASR